MSQFTAFEERNEARLRERDTKFINLEKRIEVRLFAMDTAIDFLYILDNVLSKEEASEEQKKSAEQDVRDKRAVSTLNNLLE
jgi:hypothetical protein